MLVAAVLVAGGTAHMGCLCFSSQATPQATLAGHSCCAGTQISCPALDQATGTVQKIKLCCGALTGSRAVSMHAPENAQCKPVPVRFLPRLDVTVHAAILPGRHMGLASRSPPQFNSYGSTDTFLLKRVLLI
jgi:hypothetical protein